MSYLICHDLQVRGEIIYKMYILYSNINLICLQLTCSDKMKGLPFPVRFSIMVPYLANLYTLFERYIICLQKIELLTLFRFRANHSLLFLLNAAWLARSNKYQFYSPKTFNIWHNHTSNNIAINKFFLTSSNITGRKLPLVMQQSRLTYQTQLSMKDLQSTNRLLQLRMSEVET
jgi:hypothetical protein